MHARYLPVAVHSHLVAEKQQQSLDIQSGSFVTTHHVHELLAQTPRD